MIGRLMAGMAAALALATGAAAKPLVVILADPRGTVAADLFTPYAILSASGAVEVKVVSATRALVRLSPGVAWVAPQMTLAELARTRPEGPDVVIVPAMSVADDPARSAWLRAQVRGGAQVMSICNGAKALAAAGLLDGRQATIHWWSRGRMAKAYPDVAWRRDRRWVVDGPVTTTAGISAAEPAVLDLVRRLAGEAAMLRAARRLALAPPDPRHDGAAYRLTLRGAGLVVANSAAFWRREDVAVPLAPGFDELAFGETLGAWSRTYRSTAWAVGAPSVPSRHGLVVVRSRTLPARFDRTARPGRGLTAIFEAIRAAYGAATARFTALQFEHPYGAVGASRSGSASAALRRSSSVSAMKPQRAATSPAAARSGVSSTERPRSSAV
jgi:putative intracellular protease/amidase